MNINLSNTNQISFYISDNTCQVVHLTERSTEIRQMRLYKKPRVQNVLYHRYKLVTVLSVSKKKSEEAKEGLLSLERDLRDFHVIDDQTLPAGINITIAELDDGSGIAETLKLRKAKYHKKPRSYCSSSRVKRAREKLQRDGITQNSPKSSGPQESFSRLSTVV